MAFSYRHALASAASIMILATSATAHRTAIDSRPDGTQVTTSLYGYCDLQGEECDAGDGKSLGYQVSLNGGASYFDRVYVQGNGLLTFGSAVDFLTPGSSGVSLQDMIMGGQDPSLLAYERTLVSAGQNNGYDNSPGAGDGFMQSAILSTDNGVIKATWFTCDKPQNCYTNPFTLTLTPYAQGYQGTFDFSAGSGGADRGYVVDGVFTSTGSTFFLPARYIGLSPGDVPEPASWMMMIGGFGMVGAAARRSKPLPVKANG